MAEITFNPADITAALRKNLAGYEPTMERNQVGRIIEVGDGIARVYGLRNAMAGELLEFDTEHGVVMGQVMNLELDTVGAPHDLALPRPAGIAANPLHDRIFQTDHRRHRSGTGLTGGQHQFSAAAHGAHRLGKIDGAGGHVGAEFTEGMTGRDGSRAVLLLDQPPHRNAMDEQCRLRIHRQGEFVLRPLPAEPGEGCAQRVVGLLVGPADDVERFSQILAHPHRL